MKRVSSRLTGFRFALKNDPSSAQLPVTKPCFSMPFMAFIRVILCDLWPLKILPQTFGQAAIHPYLCRPKSVLVRLSGCEVGFQWANPIIN